MSEGVAGLGALASAVMADTAQNATLPASRPRICHVSGDFPDPVSAQKTPVIRDLLQLTQQHFDHQVISLNRQSPDLSSLLSGPEPIAQAVAMPMGEALVYRALPRGVFHASALDRLGDALAERLADRTPHLLVGHKLTIEGLAVARAAHRLGLPYALSIQGNTDVKILAARPDLARRFAAAFRGAAMVFPFAPWALAQVERRLGARSGPVAMLPCPTDLDQPLAPVARGDGLVSVFHLRHHRNKNLAGLVAALGTCAGTGQPLTLEVIGGGDDRATAACQRIVARAPGATLSGPLGRAALRAKLNRATGLVLASHRESYGLVLIEALFAGTPVIYPANAAIDGYFDGAPFALRVDVRHRKALAAAMQHMVENEVAMKQALREWQHSAHACQFAREEIAQTFADGLARAIGPHEAPSC